VYLIVGVVCGRQLSYGLARSEDKGEMFPLVTGLHVVSEGPCRGTGRNKTCSFIGFGLRDKILLKKKIK
jgi:hypothetical protein